MGIAKFSRKYLPPSVRMRANKVLSSIGYRRPIDRRQDGFDIIRLIHNQSTRRPISRLMKRPLLVEAPTHRCIAMESAAFSCDPKRDNPFVLTCVEIIKGISGDYSSSSLYRFYSTFQPSTIAEYLDCAVTHPALSGHVYGSAFPWDVVEPGPLKARIMVSTVTFENELHGSAGRGEGAVKCGPVSMQKGEMEFLRLRRLIESIKERGYQRSDTYDGDICGQIFYDGVDYRVYIQCGHHRSAVLAALGYETIPVRIPGNTQEIVDRRKVDTWFNVRNGVFSREEALKVFDRIFAAEQPSSYAPSSGAMPSRRPSLPV